MPYELDEVAETYTSKLEVDESKFETSRKQELFQDQEIEKILTNDDIFF